MLSATHQAIPVYQTMTEIATRLIRERVLSGHYKPGSRLIPAKLEPNLVWAGWLFERLYAN